MRLGPEESSENPLMLQYFTWESKHPTLSWWQHFGNEVPRLVEMGFTQVWLPPPNKAMTKTGQGYDAYDLWDLGEFNQKGTVATRWGTKEDLLQATSAAKQAGIDVIIDAVLNHKLGADRVETFKAVPVDPENRLKDIGPPQEIEGWTAFDFLGRGNEYSDFKWTHQHFTGLDWDNRTRTKGIYRIVSDIHEGWSLWVDKELGNYDYLLGADIDHRHPEVRKDLLAWGPWVLEATGAMGFRLDAIKHMDRRFLLEFVKTARKVPGRQKLFAVSEYWSGNVKPIKPYIREFEGLMTFFDVPLHYKFHEASKAGPAFDLRTIFANTIVAFRPNDAVTFVDNHDTQIGQTLESWVGATFKLQAYALILLYGEGHPCVFYGDLYPNEECYDEDTAHGLTRLIEARKKFAYGPRTDYFQDHNCIGFVRMGDAQHPGCVVVLSNGEKSNAVPHNVRMNVGEDNAGKSYSAFFDTSGEQVDVSANGWASFPCAPGCVQVWTLPVNILDVSRSI